MDAELKRKWVEALRSGKYRQTAGMLKDEDGRYCCLGVLCAIAGSKEELFANLSVRPVEEYGVGTFDAQELAERNDAGHTFPMLADYIEKHL